MKRLPIHRELGLETAEDVVAFERAFALHVESGRPRNRRFFASALVARGAAAYAVAPRADRDGWWALDLRLVTPEEAAIDRFLDALASQPQP